jgi:hypothetical protein
MRIAVTGPPGAGKTYTFPDATHADDWLAFPDGTDRGFEGHIKVVAGWMDTQTSYLIEGVAVTYALKHLQTPPDLIYRIEHQYEPRAMGLARAEAARFHTYMMDNPDVKVQYLTSGAPK